MEDVLAGEIDSYLEKNWESIVADIERVVRIESTEDLPAAKPGAPFGPGPRAALTPVNSPVIGSIHCGLTAVSILTFATDSGGSVVNHCPNALSEFPPL